MNHDKQLPTFAAASADRRMQAINRSAPLPLRRIATEKLRDTGLALIQLPIFILINQAGRLLAKLLGVAVPGNVIGMVLLFVLLTSGVIPLRLLERGAALLTRHLAFFIIPIAVGAMDFGGLLLAHGPALLLALGGSFVVGIAVTGRVSQALAAPRKEALHEVHDHLV